MLQSTFERTLERGACGVGFVARVSGEPSHFIVETALHALGCLEHRGALAADGKSGDGAGILTQIPRGFFSGAFAELGIAVPTHEPLGLGMVFFPRNDSDGMRVLDECLAANDLRVLGWRAVPIDTEALGAAARQSMPDIRQVLVVPQAGQRAEVLEQSLYRAQKAFERSLTPGYICSLSARTVVYKALCGAHQVARFYSDLCDPNFQSALAVYHQRYSTNTLPSWEMAQPFRMLAHNGEINTLWGNRTWMRVREAELPADLCPVLIDGESDSAALDAALVLMRRTGRDITHALSMLVTPAWEEANETLSADVRAFYQAHAPLIEPWDGPAALAFTDGRVVGAALDRNGLRPCRYKITSDGLVVAGSEVGIVQLDDDRVIEKGRLGPGEMIAVDVVKQRILRNASIRRRLTRFSAPRWRAVGLLPAVVEESRGAVADAGPSIQQTFGFTQEDVRIVITPMAEEAKDAVWSMGDDAPIPPLAHAPISLYAFFRQRFAQVTNPPIDCLREAHVMSLRTWLGSRPPLIAVAAPTPLIELPDPLLSFAMLSSIRSQTEITNAVVDCTFDVVNGDLETALEQVALEAESAVRGGAGLLVLSDVATTPKRSPIPMALAVGIIHHRLVDRRLRARTGIVVETGDCWDVHHVAVLIACGATVVCPWLALRIAQQLDPDNGESYLLHALRAGLLKVMSKIGISTVASYRGSQHLEALGLADEVVDRCFAGMPSAIGGLDFVAIDRAAKLRHAAAHGVAYELPDYGRVRFRRGEGAEHHAWNPTAVRSLQSSVGSARAGGGSADDSWREFTILSNHTRGQLRDLLAYSADCSPVPLETVEPATDIVRRFVTSAMSLGALSPEAHATLTIAMNRLGARSNSGEGGEDPELYRSAGADRLDNKIKQVASGRFGVTAEYLARADELEIKIAQGSKPGEGGQLPANKVTGLIARLRHSQPGVALISPPPHHDIYSIEDLAQLIYDLKRVNPDAHVGVKLVAEWGVGTIAAGVAKAYADYIVISGHSGGTGASPLTSIKHAGVPWELGLAEAQRALVTNGLRARVRLRTDGGLMTGRDVVIATLLGAEEYAFGTAALVALGCDMARQCHRDSCPTGIATQRPELRAKFRGTPENVMSYFLRVAEDVRAGLAQLGFTHVTQAVGRVDLLHQVSAPQGVSVEGMLERVSRVATPCEQARNDSPVADDLLNQRIFADAHASILNGARFRGRYTICNSDRTIGARLSGAIGSKYGHAGLPAGRIRLRFRGSAGQSFGAFCARGLALVLDGEANDYVGKSLSGGKIVLRPTGAARRAPNRNVILGNVALYGATSGQLFAAGRAGERFAVRNSGADAVVEGVGDHACEYMTGGRVLILGKTGWNFGAGMSGGRAYVYSEDADFAEHVNQNSVECAQSEGTDLSEIHALLREHVRHTGSAHAKRILKRWTTTRVGFWTVVPYIRAHASSSNPAARSKSSTRPSN